MSYARWLDVENFLESFTQLLARFLTDQEAEQIIRSFSHFHDQLRQASSMNLTRMAEEARIAPRVCRHSLRSCRATCTRGIVKTFVVSYAVKVVASLIPTLLMGRFRWKLLAVYAGKDSLRFAAFVSLFIGTVKAALCYLRRLRQVDDGWNAFMAGCIAGCWLLVDAQDRRIAVALYLTTRSMQFGWRAAVKRHWLPNIPYADALVMGISSSQILNAYIMSHESLTRQYLSFLLVHGGLVDRFGANAKEAALLLGRLAMNDATVSIPVALQENTTSHFSLMCSLIHSHTHSCHEGAGSFFVQSYPRSMKLYLPLNALMSVVFHYRQLVKNPRHFVFRIITSALRSSLFLSTYCTLAWYLTCLQRRFHKGREYPVSYYLNGFISGLSVLIEAKARRMELAMYCLPRALESFWLVLVRAGYVSNIPGGEVAYFSLAMGLLVYLYQHEPDTINPSYRSVLTRFLGVH